MCSGYAADMRQKNPTVGNSFDEIIDTKWEHLRPPVDVPQFMWWDCANCVRNIDISSTSNYQPELCKNSQTLNGDKNSPLTCLNEPDNDSSFGNTVAKGKCTLQLQYHINHVSLPLLFLRLC